MGELRLGDYVEVLPVDMCGCITEILDESYRVRIHALDERLWGAGCIRFISRKDSALQSGKPSPDTEKGR